MKIKKITSTSYKIFIFLMGLVCIFIDFVLAYDFKEYFPLDQGNSWTYLVMKDNKQYEKIIRVNDKEIIDNIETIKMVYSEDKYDCIGIDLEGVKLYKSFEKDNYEIYNPPRMRYPNLLVAEEKKYLMTLLAYNNEGEKIRTENIEDRILLESTIADVVVPAEEFGNCLKFSSITKWRDSSGNYGTSNCTTWFASNVGMVKESCVDIEYTAEMKEEHTTLELYELMSAVVNGKMIGRQ